MVKIIKIITLVLILLFSTNLFADKTDLSIVSYNVYFNNNTGKKRYPQIINYLNKKNADIIALQEVTNTFYKLIKLLLFYI